MVQSIPARSYTVVMNPYVGNAKEPEPGTFGWKLRQRRLELRLTQTLLARLCGWAPNQQSRYELNVVAPIDPARQSQLDLHLDLPPGTIASWLPPRVSRQPVRGGFLPDSFTDEEQRVLMRLAERALRDRAAETVPEDEKPA